MATQEQRNQLLATLQTGLDVRNIPTHKFQATLKDTELVTQVNKFFAEYVVESLCSTVPDLSLLPGAVYPDWSRGRVLEGVRIPEDFDPSLVIQTSYLHPRQTGNNRRPTGHEILEGLVSGYVKTDDKAGMTYKVSPDDKINGHYDLRLLQYLEREWKNLPEKFRVWARGKNLYALADIVRDDDGCLMAPYLRCDVGVPCVDWCYLVHQWRGIEPSLRS